MATIVIKDLPESTELDRQAMLAIAGGSRLRTGAVTVNAARAQRMRLFDLSPRRAIAQAAARPPPR
ncbi:hypothetical protein ACHAC9_02680 [Massilia sp. CMS3.1]|uniref:hypothetical protein n=1 Tax=Massilia sp. CMS3.1 TaxID=3373083 RepID=UPI003EE539A4